jgi:tetratricopeptide (TPR) repeat protein
MMTKEPMHRAIEEFNRAIDLEPDFASAYFGLADAYTVLSRVDPAVTYAEAYAKAEENAQKALELDESLSEAHVAVGLVSLELHWDVSTADRHYQRAIELNPNNAIAHLYYRQLLDAFGRHEEALEHILKARELDPLNPFINANVSCAYLYSGSYEQAIEASQETREIHPDNWVARWFAGQAYCQLGLYEEAEEVLQEANDILEGGDTTVLGNIGYCYARQGRLEEARAVIDTLKAAFESGSGLAYDVAVVWAGMGEEDLAVEWLEKAFQSREYMMLWLGTLPEFRTMHADVRFQDLVRRVGVMEG